MAKKPSQQERSQRAAAALEDQKRAERRRTIRSITLVVFALVVVVGIAFGVQSLRGGGEVTASPAGQSEYGVTIGEQDAPHQVVIYEDFLCPFCGQLEAGTGEELQQLADDGSVLVEYRPFNLLSRIGDYSERATSAFAVVLEESGPETAKEFHDLLYANQPSEEGPFPDNQALLDLAVEAGAEESAVSDGILGESMVDWVEAATTAAQDAGVQGTPTVLLDGEQISGDPEQILDQINETVG
ncbi:MULTISPECIES: DsbA family protein [unclassified Nocardioides]|uniref:DsbA family protein n=1 Tax=unclassified Nocardioides TaxID=2615069 RepID=UPI0007032CC1|nr:MULTISPECIES: thioredoxin domain-containing protein [unclassified Nocardioides]KQQ43199.1 disulfide bond formation protein DsbA [Nocardioides sp. Leaf307]